MSDNLSFADLLLRLRVGDQRSATDFVRRLDPSVQNSIRHLLVEMRLHRLIDPSDISQIVFANFFARVTVGQFEFTSEEQLVGLLTTMARNQVYDEARKLQAQRRDFRRQDDDAMDAALDSVQDRQMTPSKIVALDELVTQIRSRLPDETRVLAQLRGAGFDWPEIAEQVGGSPEALRKKLTRALNRVLKELDLGEVETV
ncbi:RNA polymerase sigma factor [Tuwongella immobilis]|uniref:RNA polymerase sigma-70 ECF-like HTH domain-containing protein n=1 Tax=Tuwongella immobilis TaxID=692036 RepID=A0A6C2YKH5_9BACT|nr:sigma-70 family RNA polymerase sigma factor [Tuwongella immobilis]VIP02080.1 dna-directed rna polymerase subunit sigma24 : DNA-directed RNA polymerase specialized sigma subunit, sigma24 OS=Singulisphaera acidiphila (strain ATCC BAA-1392 / DSM 18658 / VKM B-2454 / MOB10) GN=Sinac_5214 PE=4 SV=1: Sigma70_ECF [Tuwongella immobilis]VTS00326.1 dna-directed rna polymerase subunit sigma24 : DNA-directed RNA polymerase specialized sigma subunit, sigma24 OS=Singulisphaera acidiphila (strain ATCC BAA-13